MFWIGFGLDYLPVLLGASEMPAAARGVLLGGDRRRRWPYILYRWILRRTFVRLGDRSMALLLERRFGGFHDSLVTAVEMADVPDHASAFSRELLGPHDRTRPAPASATCATCAGLQHAARWSGSCCWRLRWPLRWSPSMAPTPRPSSRRPSGCSCSATSPGRGARRSKSSGIEVLRDAAPGEDRRGRSRFPSKTSVVKVAKGSNVSLKVRAAQAPEAQVVPQHCTVYYRTLKSGAGIRGERGSVTMSNFRDADDWRNFWFDGKPFKGVLSTIEFDVVGYDHRVSGYRLEVVDSPAVVETLLDLVYPQVHGR